MPKSEDKQKQSTRYRPFEDARDFARSLGLNTHKEWLAFVRGEIPDLPPKPNDIPNIPAKAYSKPPWRSYDDWLREPSSWRPFEEARDFARNLRLKSYKDWRKYCGGMLPRLGTKPADIPATPSRVYRLLWIDMEDWLGLPQQKRWRPFKEARKFVRSLKLKNNKEWRRYLRGELPDKPPLPKDISYDPSRTYKRKGWVSWGDFFGTGTIANSHMQFKPFEEAREFARNLKFQGGNEWRAYCKGELPEKGSLPDDVPSNPNRTYRNKGWVSWGDWLGTGTIANYNKVYKAFPKAREFVRTLGLNSANEWRSYCKGELPEKGKKPDDIPATPHASYKNRGWVSWGDWLGTGTIAYYYIKFKPFGEAREFARSLKLKNIYDWQKYCKGTLPGKGLKPDDIPVNPDGSYKNKGWVSWGDWLGTGSIAVTKKRFKPFKEAREFARSLKLTGETDWRKYYRGELPGKGLRPDDIPSNPSVTYKDKGWISMGDWLGTGNIASNQIKYKSFKEAREYARSLKLTSARKWGKYCKGELPEKGKKPDDIPACPDASYKNKGWVNWGDWLGTGTIASYYMQYRPFDKAREFARSLKLISSTEWLAYSAGRLPQKGHRPEDIPASPSKKYKDKWKGWQDFLGNE